METTDFVVVGSSGGGGTIAWLLAKAGYKVVVLELGTDWARPLEDETLRYDPDRPGKPLPNEDLRYNPLPHDEYRFRVERPEWKRRPRGDYNTYRSNEFEKASPFGAGWTASMLGGGSVIWGAWCFRALPIDFRLATHFKETGQAEILRNEGYTIPDWPIAYSEMEPFYNVAETLLAVSGNREPLNEAIRQTRWFERFGGMPHFQQSATEWFPRFPFPCPEYPLTPAGFAVERGFREINWKSARLPSGMVAPGSSGYSTREAIGKALDQWGADRPEFWDRSADTIWSDRIRDACNMCGFCGEYLCWGKNGPKSGSRASSLKELRDLPNAEVVTNAKAYEVVYDERTRRATGVRYLDISDPDRPRAVFQPARFVIVSCGAVQSARLLRMSGPPAGLGNRYDQLGRYITFHLFGLGTACTLPPKFQGALHGHLGHTGNVVSFDPYFLEDKETGFWWKGATAVSAAKKNPLENATGAVRKDLIHDGLLDNLEAYNRTMEIRLTGDDLPMASNRVDLDPSHVDEYGLPVARITRGFGPAERRMFKLSLKALEDVWRPYTALPLTKTKSSEGNPTLIGDHQMGTCRMGDDPTQSVLDRFCRLHELPNVFVVDSSFMPTGLGLNPMVTVVANALRVGTWLVEELKKGNDLERPLRP
ncbi:MAG TPA: GMC family oxidoreductase [Thermoanaerobaculia bacterium]|nr:GMC family oxidoreductase [Thermoanaerobaculia bacterium]